MVEKVRNKEREEVKIDKDIATNLLTAIYTDTGGFKHSNTTNNTLNNKSSLTLKITTARYLSENETKTEFAKMVS